MTTPLYDWIYHQYAPATALPTPQQPLVELHEFPIYNTSNNNEIIGSYRGLRATQPIEVH
jgi:hypothetical protein